VRFSLSHRAAISRPCKFAHPSRQLRIATNIASPPKIAYTLGKMTNAETLGAALSRPPLTIGGLRFSGCAFLAPMAGSRCRYGRNIAEASWRYRRHLAR